MYNDRDPPLLYVAPTIVQQRHNYLHKYHWNQENWLDDQNAEESLKNLIISRIDDIYLDELKEPIF